MVDAVGIEPTTCRLRAVRLVLAPATTGCHNVLSFLQFSQFFLPSIAIRTPEIMPHFEGAWAQKWAQSTEVNPFIETNWNWHTCRHLPGDLAGSLPALARLHTPQETASRCRVADRPHFPAPGLNSLLAYPCLDGCLFFSIENRKARVREADSTDKWPNSG